MAVKDQTEKRKISTGLSGVAGEYFVAAELSRLGYLASITMRNAKGVDILVTNINATNTAAIQVKTRQDAVRDWVLSDKCELQTSEHFFYIFVSLGGLKGVPTFHIVPSKIVAAQIRESHQAWLKGKPLRGTTRKDSSVRKFVDQDAKFLNRWDLLGLD